MIIGFLYKYFGKDSHKGNNLVFEDIQGKGKVLRRMGPIVYLGTFITILLGGSTGREGAAVQMGSSIAESVNRLFKVIKIDQKILLMSGISGGFGAAFGTPITGAIFGMEVVSLGKMKFEALIPCLTASFVGHLVATKAWRVEHEQFIVKSVPDISTNTIIKVIILAIIFSFVSVLYSQLRHGIQKYSTKYLGDPMLRGFVGGIIIIALAYLMGSTDYNGRGLDMIEEAFTKEVPHYAFLAKLVFTAVTMGSGFVGGEAIPLFFMGSTLGNTLSAIVDLPTSFLAALGLIAVFCGGANVPIAAFIMGIEMFEGKGIEFFFITCVISYIFSGHHGVWPSQQIYEPKSRMLNLPSGQSISTIEQKKKD
ncbi:chloride channel protein [Halalkalibacter kiskunsagensis]|uniref:Chloride channel protein n=1 Tax=Halalkalibacter kiskunsagensis TaxID=1548599 RepID=A0ABV6KJ63_9BACI